MDDEEKLAFLQSLALNSVRSWLSSYLFCMLHPELQDKTILLIPSDFMHIQDKLVIKVSVQLKSKNIDEDVQLWDYYFIYYVDSNESIIYKN